MTSQGLQCIHWVAVTSQAAVISLDDSDITEATVFSLDGSDVTEARTTSLNDFTNLR